MPCLCARVYLPQVQVGGSPIFTVDKKLGKGGFGQVFLGKRLPATRKGTKDPEGAGASQVPEVNFCLAIFTIL